MGVRSDLTCWHCGSPLESVGARCTACNPPVSSIELELPLYTINTHVRCVRCGYDLHGLAVEGMCAECQCPVRRSLELDNLANADHHYLRSLYWGVTLFCAGCAMGAGSLILIWAAEVFRRFRLAQTPTILITTAAMLVVASGFFMLSRPDPAQRHAAWVPDSRLVARSLLVLLLILYGIMILQQVNTGLAASIMRARLLIITTTMVEAGFFSACAAYLRELFIRTGSFWRADVARRLTWQLAALYLTAFCLPAGVISQILLLWLLWPLRHDLAVMLRPGPEAAATARRYAP